MAAAVRVAVRARAPGKVAAEMAGGWDNDDTP
jgi:hypothetical protein